MGEVRNVQNEEDNGVLPDLDSLLQCPICYEIPVGQIYQCNEGHHVCERCKARINLCPVCRALFFGTRNYALEELIGNFRKLRAFRIAGRNTTGILTPGGFWPPPREPETGTSGSDTDIDMSILAPPNACKGVFRCLCCDPILQVKLPAARILNHLRYYHAQQLIEGEAENGQYTRIWQSTTNCKRLVTALRVVNMGIFFLTIEFNDKKINAWLSMAASAMVSACFSYTLTLSGCDRQAIFINTVSSVRSCEGSLKKHGQCLSVTGADSRALNGPRLITTKLTIRRIPLNQQGEDIEPRFFLRIASRITRRPNLDGINRDLEPFLEDLQEDIARLSRAFTSLGHSALTRLNEAAGGLGFFAGEIPLRYDLENEREVSRSTRRRMRQRLRASLIRERRAREHTSDDSDDDQIRILHIPNSNSVRRTGLASIRPAVAPDQATTSGSGTSHTLSSSGNSSLTSSSGSHGITKRKRRHRR